MTTIAIINGANLNMLGTREPQHYGKESLDEINNNLKNTFDKIAMLSFFQSNHEGEIIDHIQSLKNIDAIIINPGAFTHTSVAIRDALLAKGLPSIEVHLSNIHKREEFRKTSLISDICLGTISGLGAKGYELAIEGALSHLKQ